MQITRSYLQVKGILLEAGDDPTSYFPARAAIVKEAITTLLKKDYPTKDITGRYIDKQFEVLSIEINPQDLRSIPEQKATQLETMGWNLGKKVNIGDRLDEVCAVMAMSSCLSSVPDKPGDIRMNSFRFYDVLRLLTGDGFNNQGSFEIQEETPTVTRWMRFKYFKFIVTQLKPFIRNFTYEELLAGLFTMQIYQLMPCLAAAFRLKEIAMEWSQTRLAYPVLEQKNWTESALTDLLTTVRVKDTPEWVKIMPLVDDEEAFLNSTVEKARIAVPNEEVRYDEREKLRLYNYFALAPDWNYAVVDFYGSFAESWLERLTNLGMMSNQKGYKISYEVSIKGYYLGAANFDEGDDLLKLYRDVVHPDLWALIKSSCEDQNPTNTLAPYMDKSRLTTALTMVASVINEAEFDIFQPILDYTSRMMMIASSLKIDGRILPLYYSISNGTDILFSSEED